MHLCERGVMRRDVHSSSRSAHFTVKYSSYPFRCSVPRRFALESAKSRSLQRALDRYYRDSRIQHIPHARIIACSHHHLPVGLLHLSFIFLFNSCDADLVVPTEPSLPLTAFLGSIPFSRCTFCSPQPNVASRGSFI